MNPQKKLKLGTRRSLLARAQSTWVARELEKRVPGLSVELVGIDTRGDLILDVPLSSVEGKEFFVAEIDQALRSGQVDFTVHSLKDLSLDRPEDLSLAAVPRRENPRDIAVFGPGIFDRLRSAQPLKIGTSAPRRLENLPDFLSRALPTPRDAASPKLRDPASPRLTFEEIRGNVNTRLKRLHEPVSSDRHLDGVILALAGLVRLWRDEEGRAELETLLKGARFMVLPITLNPTAPGQGALAVECLAKNTEVRELLRLIHDPESECLVREERAVLAEWGGGCHQRFGATAIAQTHAAQKGDTSYLFIKGRAPVSTEPSGYVLDEVRWAGPVHAPKKLSVAYAWSSMDWPGTPNAIEQTLPPRIFSESAPAIFIAHSRAWPAQERRFETLARAARVWTSGPASWFRLAAQGIWVEGCAEGLGFDSIAPTLQEPVLKLPRTREWFVLTHTEAADTEGGWLETGHDPERVIGTYAITPPKKEELEDAVAGLLNATHCWWGSGSHFLKYLNALGPEFPDDAHHSCGPGKTARELRRAAESGRIRRWDVFPSFEEWKKWTHQKNTP